MCVEEFVANKSEIDFGDDFVVFEFCLKMEVESILSYILSKWEDYYVVYIFLLFTGFVGRV